MTFRNIVLLFLTFLFLTGCKGLSYYNNATNPARLSVIFKSPTHFYTNINQQDSLAFYLVNHNSQTYIAPHWWTDLWLIGQSRFYPKEILIRPQPNDLRMKALIIEPNDTVLLIKIPVSQVLGKEKNWLYKSKNVYPPHLITSKKFYSYIYFTAEYTTKIPNQEEVIKIRSGKQKLTINQFKEAELKSKKTILGLSADISSYSLKEKKGTLICSIENISEYPIQLFNDPGSVRFKLYAYNPNRTTMMFTQMVLDNGKLPINPMVINSKATSTLTIPLEQVLFQTAPENPIYYWSWNKKAPPVSPLVYGKKDLAVEVEFWFGIVVDGKEYFSNIIKLPIMPTKKNSSKK